MLAFEEEGGTLPNRATRFPPFGFRIFLSIVAEAAHRLTMAFGIRARRFCRRSGCPGDRTFKSLDDRQKNDDHRTSHRGSARLTRICARGAQNRVDLSLGTDRIDCKYCWPNECLNDLSLGLCRATLETASRCPEGGRRSDWPKEHNMHTRKFDRDRTAHSSKGEKPYPHG
jgi:hypothetical protein